MLIHWRHKKPLRHCDEGYTSVGSCKSRWADDIHAVDYFFYFFLYYASKECDNVKPENLNFKDTEKDERGLDFLTIYRIHKQCPNRKQTEEIWTGSLNTEAEAASIMLPLQSVYGRDQGMSEFSVYKIYCLLRCLHLVCFWRQCRNVLCCLWYLTILSVWRLLESIKMAFEGMV